MSNTYKSGSYNKYLLQYHLIFVCKYRRKLFASSNIASDIKNPITKDLSVRHWTCPNCGTYHDRDENAADNILAEGKRIVELKITSSNSDEFQIAS